MMDDTRRGCVWFMGLITFVSLFGAILAATLGLFTPARGTDLALVERLGSFGMYTDRHLQKRWKLLCAGGGRYQAMSEAYDRGKPNPCQ